MTLETVLQEPVALWPGATVPYAFDPLSAFTVANKENVRRAMDLVEEITGCVTFLEVEGEQDMVVVTSRHGEGWVQAYIDPPLGGCWARLGRQGEGRPLYWGSQHAVLGTRWAADGGIQVIYLRYVLRSNGLICCQEPTNTCYCCRPVKKHICSVPRKTLPIV